MPIIIDFEVNADMFLLLNLKKLLYKFSNNYSEDIFLISSLLTFRTLLLLLLQLTLTTLFSCFYFLFWIHYSTLLIVDFVLAPFLLTLKRFFSCLIAEFGNFILDYVMITLKRLFLVLYCWFWRYCLFIFIVDFENIFLVPL